MKERRQMSNDPDRTEDRRRRRLGLLWFGGVLAALLLVVAGMVVGRGVTGDQRTASGEAGGSGTAPVLDGPPLDSPAAAAPGGTASPGTSSTRPTPAAERELSGPSSVGQAAGGPTPTPTATRTPPRPHGLALILTSTLDAPLSPGVHRTLTVHVRNPNPFPVSLFRVDVRVMDPPAVGCLPSWVRTGHYRYITGTPRKVGASSTVNVALPIELVNLVDVNQDACWSTAFPLRLSGMGVAP